MRKKIILIVLAAVCLLAIVYGFQVFNTTTATYDPGMFNKQYDVIVVGGGTGGVAAALQAGRMGVKVALIESTDWLGGQMTAAAVGSLDEGYLLGDDYGIFKEFMGRVKAYYGDKPINTCYWGTGSRCIEPHVGNQILKDMVAENKNIDLYFRTNVYKVITYNKKIVGVETASKVPEHNLLRFKAPVLIDATEYGDMLPLAGASYRVGNETNATAQSGSGSCIQSITYSAVVRKYFDGVPPELVMDVNDPPGGEDSYKKFSAIFSRGVKKDGNAWFINGKATVPYSWSFAAGFRGLPDSDKRSFNYSADLDGIHYTDYISKTVINMSNDVPANVDFIEDKNMRKRVTCEAKLRTLQYIYYLQNELGEKDWSLALDEGYNTPYNIEENSCPNITGKLKNLEKYFPVMPYVREGRRMVGLQTEDSYDIVIGEDQHLSQTNFINAVATGDYFPDLHGCRQKADFESIDSEKHLSDTRRVFQIPMGVFISSDIDGLLSAEKNISVSRIVNGMTRLQPVAMYTGQAAGAIAATAAIKKVTPKQLDPLDIQNELSKDNLRFTLTRITDVDIEKYPYVQSLVTNKILTLVNNAFRPDNIVTRADWSVMVTRLIDIMTLPANNYQTKISDIPQNDSIYPYAAEVLNRKLVTWCDTAARQYCPAEILTRSQVAYTLNRLYRSKILPEKRTTTDITDLNGKNEYKESIDFVLKTGLMDYCDETSHAFCPDAQITRLQIAEILAKALKLQ